MRETTRQNVTFGRRRTCVLFQQIATGHNKGPKLRSAAFPAIGLSESSLTWPVLCKLVARTERPQSTCTRDRAATFVRRNFRRRCFCWPLTGRRGEWNSVARNSRRNYLVPFNARPRRFITPPEHVRSARERAAHPASESERESRERPQVETVHNNNNKPSAAHQFLEHAKDNWPRHER